jgi:hypothetical protein
VTHGEFTVRGRNDRRHLDGAAQPEFAHPVQLRCQCRIGVVAVPMDSHGDPLSIGPLGRKTAFSRYFTNARLVKPPSQ